MIIFGAFKVAVTLAMVFLATIPSEALRGGLIRSGRETHVNCIDDPSMFFARPIRSPSYRNLIRFGHPRRQRFMVRLRRGDSEEEESNRFG
uniref:Secreted protein n=1 Tax=Panagrellus redivivus TaxID=6233 RepID=A0A7E4ZU63_PANRE